MSIEKEAIAEAIKQLDPDVDTNWTDDGSPMVEEVQKLCNDASVTRANINDAIPSYDRKVASFAKGGKWRPPAGAKPLFAKSDESGQGVGGEKSSTDTIVTADMLPPNPEPRRQGGVHLEDDEARQILKDRVDRANDALIQAKRDTSEARDREVEAEKRLNRAMTDLQRKFPPISQAANIKAHLEAQGRLAEQRAGLVGVADARLPIQRSMEDRKRNPLRAGFQPIRAIS